MNAPMQLDLFGNPCSIPEAPPPSRRFKTMQELHGTNPHYKCRDCNFRMIFQYSKNYNKCCKWHVSNSTATDIKVSATACGLFEMRRGDIKVYMGR